MLFEYMPSENMSFFNHKLRPKCCLLFFLFFSPFIAFPPCLNCFSAVPFCIPPWLGCIFFAFPSTPEFCDLYQSTGACRGQTVKGETNSAFGGDGKFGIF